MAKRNLPEEIKSIKERATYGNNRHGIISQLERLSFPFAAQTKALSKSKKHDYDNDFDKEVYKYIPIAIVTCFESFFQSIVKDLIDIGEPYSLNAAKFNQSQNIIRFDFEIVKAIQHKSITIGDVVAHLLSYSSIEDINSHLSLLIGGGGGSGYDFISEVKRFKKSIYLSESEPPEEKPLPNPGEVIPLIRKTYELRHIFCHESNPAIEFSRESILELLKNALTFLYHTNEYVYNHLYPNAPNTTQEMILESREYFEENEAELENLIKSIRTAIESESIVPYDMEQFNVTIDAWKNYREINARFHASEVDDDVTTNTLLYLHYIAKMTVEKMESLREEYEYYLHKNTQKNRIEK